MQGAKVAFISCNFYGYSQDSGANAYRSFENTTSKYVMNLVLMNQSYQ